MKKILKTFLILFLVSPILAHDVREDVKKYLQNNAIVIDVRTPEEFQLGHYKDALNIPHDQIESRLKEIEKYKNMPIIVYCRSGRRSGIAKQILEKNGFKNVLNGINITYFPKN